MGNGGHYGGIEYSIHTDPVVRALPAFVRGTYIQLFSLPENTALPGLILAGRLGLAESLGLDLDIFDDHIALLRQQGLVCVDWAARVCYVPAKARMVCNAAPSIWSARHWRKVINSAPSCALVEQAERDARALLMGRLRASRGDGRGKAILASFLHGEAVGSAQADIVLNTVAAPAQQPLPFAWEPPPKDGARPHLHVLEPEEVNSPMPTPIPKRDDRADAPPESREAAASPDPNSASAVPTDDDAVTAFQTIVQAAGGPGAVGMARVYASDATGLPGNAAITWCQLWARLRRERPDTTLQSAQLLGEYGRAGGWVGLRCPWQAMVKSLANLAAMLDEAEDWHRRGRPSARRGQQGPRVQGEARALEEARQTDEQSRNAEHLRRQLDEIEAGGRVAHGG